MTDFDRKNHKINEYVFNLIEQNKNTECLDFLRNAAAVLRKTDSDNFDSLLDSLEIRKNLKKIENKLNQLSNDIISVKILDDGKMEILFSSKKELIYPFYDIDDFILKDLKIKKDNKYYLLIVGFLLSEYNFKLIQLFLFLKDKKTKT